jgi:membrane protease YdiL (CAAX protease family)
MEPDDNLEVAPPALPHKSWLDRLQALFEVVLLSGFVSSLLASLPFSFAGRSTRANLLTDVRLITGFLLVESVLAFALLLLILRAHGETLKDFGLSLNSWRLDSLLGMAVVPVLFALNLAVAAVFQVFFPRSFLEHNPLTGLIHTPKDLGLFIVAALIAGGFKEELQRAFILRRFQAHLGGARVGLVLWSFVFGIGHYVQGTQGVVAASLFGLIFGLVYLWRGSLIAPMVAHGAYDTIALLGAWFLGQRG